MLHKKNSGKYFSADFYETRNEGLRDSRNLDDSETSWVDLEFPEGGGEYDPETYTVYSLFKGKKIDVRKLPERD